MHDLVRYFVLLTESTLLRREIKLSMLLSLVFYFPIVLVDILYSVLEIFNVTKIGKRSLISVLMMPLENSACTIHYMINDCCTCFCNFCRSINERETGIQKAQIEKKL